LNERYGKLERSRKIMQGDAGVSLYRAVATSNWHLASR